MQTKGSTVKPIDTTLRIIIKPSLCTFTLPCINYCQPTKMFLHNKAIITPNSPRSTTLAPPCVLYGKCHPESSKEVFFIFFKTLGHTQEGQQRESKYGYYFFFQGMRRL
mmetsp:Transcript_13458/g.18048  ORF Transcript_13458/g.18048 Transcript_13458/m.18048 type:complete len:109 (-) Transcript_13458:942-1268(-)